MINYQAALAKNILVILISILIGLSLFEVMAGIIIKQELKNDHERSRRYMLFAATGGAPVFRNQANIFTYIPNSTIRAITFYENGATLHKEYDYEFKTNNFGLVQKLDVDKNRSSILLLGDSFTEGQGAIPWFYDLENGNRGHPAQLINGGLLGTGFAQWKLLHDQLEASSIRIDKVIVLFISDDYQRVVWNFPDRVLNCLGDIKKCNGDEGYFPLPNVADMESFVDDLRKFRDAEYSNKQAVKESRFFRKYLPSLHFIWGYIKNDYKVQFANANSTVIEFLIKKYGKSIVFIHLPTKEELERGNTPNHVGQLAREKLNIFGGKLIDGFKVCDLEPSDYFINDPHPNPGGYKKISRCVDKVIHEIN